MQHMLPESISTHSSSSWVRLRTLIILRWIAIAGQVAAIGVGLRVFELDLDIGLCSMAVGLSVIANLIAAFVYPENKRLTQRELTLTLVFDLTQLAILLFLTGGINNPFALLMLAPVTISASTLRLRYFLVVGAYGIALATLITLFNLPLVTQPGMILRMPMIFTWGFWLAIVIGIVFLGFYAQRVTSEIATMSDALLATQMALGREQKLTDLAGVVAATAHELGTPLATIKLTSSELAEELDDEILRQDAMLISEQADRCRDILRSMGRAGKKDKHISHAPISAIVQEAAEPHMDRGKSVIISVARDHDGETEPDILRMPEVVHGVRNLVQNAVDFSQSTVWVDMDWSDKRITLRIVDDGKGYSPQVLARIGDPFMRSRGGSEERPGYEGMGLGLFIAKNLLERTGAELSFANGRDSYSPMAKAGERAGAIVEVAWKRSLIEAQPDLVRGPLGENAHVEL